MIELVGTYLDSEYIDWVMSFFALFPAGILLTALAWGFGYLVHALLNLFRA